MKVRRVFILLLLISLVGGLVVATTLVAASTAAPADGSIGGRVLYRGLLSGAPDVAALLFANPAAAPLTDVELPFPGGDYNFGSGPDGSYYVAAQIDPDNSGGPPDPGEPFAWYDADLDGSPDPVTINGSNATGIDISLPVSATWWYAGEEGGSNLGESVAAAGDVNGDGYGDVLVGARLYDNSGYGDAGRAYLFYGSASGLSASPTIIDPPVLNTNGFFGDVVASAGDVNGDGYGDILVSMPNYESDSGTPDEGAVFVWYGSDSGIGSSYDWRAESDLYYAHLGPDYGAGSAGDVNGDGYDDIIVGANRYDNNIVSHVFVWFGSENGLDPDGSRAVGRPANADWQAAAPTGASWETNRFGNAVGTAGDVNGDGYADIYVAAGTHESDVAQKDEGGIFVWYGSGDGLGDPGTLANADWSVEGNQQGARLGYSGAAAGDFDGDGYGDLVAGAYLYDDGAENEGMLFFYPGGESGLAASPGWTAAGQAAQMQLGFTLGAGADYNGDGLDDLLASAHGFAAAALTPLTNAGAALLWYGVSGGWTSPGTPLTAGWLATGDVASAFHGYHVAAAGDVNGDGLDDVLVGNLNYDNAGQSADGGRAYLYHGAPDMIEGLAVGGDSPAATNEPVALTATISAGTMVSYTWNFSDEAIAYGAHITRTFEMPGIYTATVTASNALHSRSAATVIVVEEAIAGLSASNDGPTALGDPTTFQASRTAGSNVSYSWDFGDGQTGTGANPTHTYAAAGSYTATVTAANALGSATAQTAVLVEAALAGLTASNDGPGLVGQAVTLEATVGAGDNVTYSWTFGDGASGAGAVVQHVYTAPGSYEATVVASNSVSSDSATTVVTVKAGLFLPLVTTRE